VTLVLLGCVAVAVPWGPTAGAAPTPAPVGDPAGLVRPLDGTGTGPVSPGTVGEFPGADLPFGMIQWSPDSTPDVAASGGGYSYADSAINGFSLDHLSGTGCPSYGDVPILPTVGPVGPAPAGTSDSFSHADEHAAPGRYAVTLGPSGIGTQLAVTTRTGLSRFTYPATADANVLVKVADSANPATTSSVRVVGRDELTGRVTSGGFCGTGGNYTLYFVARFDRPFTGAGSWDGASVSPGRSSCTGSACGAYVTFDTRSDRAVMMKVGISYVSVADAADNLAVEDPGWSLGQVQTRATAAWNAVLGRIAVGGGSLSQQRTFTTALYHSLLDPDVVSDDNGQYPGSDGRVHRSAGGAHYANFSEWDIYRSEIQLVSLVAPKQAGDMVQSLVDDGTQNGWLPKWAIVGGDESQMNGDSADPIIADAYAFGVRNFDVHRALAEMVKGATEAETGHGLEIERQYLSQYLSQHFVPADSLDLTSIDYSIGGSVTLEYAIDDFAIARMALALGDHAVYQTLKQRAHNWEYLFNPSTGYLQARAEDGSFPAGPAFATSQFEPGGQLGFEEGNAIQYTWAAPQDLSALASLMGGDAAAIGRLNTFFTSLNATRYQPYDWAGNEPGLWAPWEYDYVGAPEQAQATVRTIADELYADAPVDEPGNDDLGAISSWYVWAALGLYPVTPGTGDLALASPLFPTVSVLLPDGHRLVEHAAAASAYDPYVHSLTVTGVTRPAPAPSCKAAPSTARSTSAGSSTSWTQPWLPASVLTTGGVLTYGLSSRPDPSWGTDPGAAPPSYGTGRLPAVGFSLPSGATAVTAGQTTTVQLGAAAAQPGVSVVHWSAAGAGLTVTPSSGQLEVGGGCPSSATVSPTTLTLTVGATAPGSFVLHVTLEDAGGTPLPPVAVDVQVSG
jgi:predicted alpha-1,2-mannosidase